MEPSREPDEKSGADTGASAEFRLVIMFTDIVDSVGLIRLCGEEIYACKLSRYYEILDSVVKEGYGKFFEKEGDGAGLTFPDAPSAVRVALEFQKRLFGEDWGGHPIRVRIGIHEDPAPIKPSDGGKETLTSLAKSVTARIQSLAKERQILMSRPVADKARAKIPLEDPVDEAKAKLPLGDPVAWVAHGPYRFQGIADEPLEIFEAGIIGISPLTPPSETEKADRTASKTDLSTLGWRPSVNAMVPGVEEEWKTIRKLGEGGFGEVWLAKDADGRKWVMKFCFSMYRLRSFQVEKTITRYLLERLGNRSDLVSIHHHHLDSFPLFLVSEYVENGNLAEWAKGKGGIGAISPQTRLSLLTSAARAVGAAHGVGVIHKDVKPANIMIGMRDDETPYARLIDFGIGIMSDVTLLDLEKITREGLTGRVLADNISSRTFTRMYSPPEYLNSRAPASVKGDIYALGVVLYQLVVGDLERPLTADWRASVQSVQDADMLAEDIARCTAENPDNRFDSCEELAQSLEALPARRAAKAARLERERREAKNHRLVRIGIVAGAMLFLVAVVSLWAYREANTARKIAEKELYRTGLGEANRLFLEGNLPEAQETMENLPEAFRGWEFGYLDRLIRESGPVLVEKEKSNQEGIIPPQGRLHRSTDRLSVSLTYTWGEVSLETKDVGNGKVVLGNSYLGYLSPVVISPKGTLLAARHKDIDTEQNELHFISTESGNIVHRRLVDNLPDNETLFGDFLDENRFVWVLSDGKSGCLDLRDKKNDKEWRIELGANDNSGTDRITDFALHPGRSLMALRIEHAGEFRPDIEVFSALDGGRNRGMESPARFSSAPYRIYDWEYLISQLAFSPSGESLAAAFGAQIYMWSVDTGVLTDAFDGHAAPITILRFSRDGKRLASGDSTGQVWLRSMTGAKSKTAFHRLPGEILNLLFLQDDRHLTLYSPTERQTYLLPADADLKVKKTVFSDMEVRGIEFVDNPSRLCLYGTQDKHGGGGPDPFSALINLGSGSSVKQTLLPGPSNSSIYDVKCSSDGRWIFALEHVDSVFRIRKYDSSMTNPTLEFVTSKDLPSGFMKPVWTLSPDGSRVLILSDAGSSSRRSSRRWICYDSETNEDLGDGEGIIRETVNDSRIKDSIYWLMHDMDYSPNGDRIALLWHSPGSLINDEKDLLRVSLVDANTFSPVMADGVEIAWTIRMPHVPESALIRAIQLRHGDIMALFHRNLNYLDLVETTTGKNITRLRGHSGGILDVIALPDGKRLATISGDRSIRIWDISTGATLLTIPDALEADPGDADVSIRSSPDGAFLAWTDARGTKGLHYGCSEMPGGGDTDEAPVTPAPTP